jgi:hypothetical protein
LVSLLLLLGSEAWNLSSGPLSKPHVVSDASRRNAFQNFGLIAASTLVVAPLPSRAIPGIDVNNAMAREFTAFPGLYPTIATKIVNGAKDEPFKSKKDVYAILSESEQERMRQYDKSIVISKPDKSLQQFKTSQICKYECGGRVSNAYRDEQIKAIQRDRAN